MQKTSIRFNDFFLFFSENFKLVADYFRQDPTSRSIFIAPLITNDLKSVRNRTTKKKKQEFKDFDDDNDDDEFKTYGDESLETSIDSNEDEVFNNDSNDSPKVITQPDETMRKKKDKSKTPRKEYPKTTSQSNSLCENMIGNSRVIKQPKKIASKCKIDKNNVNSKIKKTFDSKLSDQSVSRKYTRQLTSKENIPSRTNNFSFFNFLDNKIKTSVPLTKLVEVPGIIFLSLLQKLNDIENVSLL